MTTSRASCCRERQMQARRYRGLSSRLRIPDHAIDGSSLLALADVAIGGGRDDESGVRRSSAPRPTRCFAGELAAVDAELIRQGRLHDLRSETMAVVFEKKTNAARKDVADPEPILEAITNALVDVSVERGSRRRPRRRGPPS